MTGRTISHYQILEKLGEGGMGVVYKAHDTHLDRFVAIKFLPPERVADPERKLRFVQEAKAASALNHPNIVHIYDIDQQDGVDYIAMEYVGGKTLGESIGRKGLSLKETLHYGIQAADALAKAHAAGIVHRDLKPCNIMVTEDGLVKILDFGLAKLTETAPPGEDESTRTLKPTTEESKIVGTAAYMSPEQAEGKRLDARSDIFSFGSVLYEMVTGRPAFRGKSKISTLAAVIDREPEPLSGVAPRDLEKVVSRCLRKELDRRFQHMADVRVALAELKEDSDSGKLEPAAPAPAKRRRRWLWAAGFATLAVLAAFASYRWLAPRPAAPFQRMQITRLTDSGKASAAAISPDGKYVVHAVSNEGMSSLWIRHAATGSNVQILPPAKGSFSNLNFSGDGNSLYYVFSTGTPPPAMYTMPVLGGNSRKLAAFPGIETASLSRDEKRLVFVRRIGEDSGLFVVNLDGSGERQLAARKVPEVFRSSVWSPDGKTIAYGVRSYRGGYSHSLAAIPVEGGPEKRIGSQTWRLMSNLRWLPDGRGLIAIAGDQELSSKVWYVSYPGGEARKITNDLNNYGGQSLTWDSSALVTVQSETTTRIWVVSTGDGTIAREITTGRRDGVFGLDWTADGNIVFGAPDSSQDLQLWITAADGTGRRQITTEGSLNAQPAVCGDGRHLVFLSYRAGTPHIWRSDLDGGNARQLTSGEGEFIPSCSPDGTWIAYGSLDPRSVGVLRMPIDGGVPVRIWDQYGSSWISPDGKSVLVREIFVAEPKFRIIPATGGQPVRTFDPVSELGGGAAQWSADGAALLYVKTSGGVSNIWRRPLGGGEPKQVTSFTSDEITSFAVSRDGKKLALARGTTTSDVVLIRDLK